MAKALTIALIGAAPESANAATALRIVAAALKKGMDVSVFVSEEAESSTRAALAALLEVAREKGARLESECLRPESAAAFSARVQASANTLLIPTR